MIRKTYVLMLVFIFTLFTNCINNQTSESNLLHIGDYNISVDGEQAIVVQTNIASPYTIDYKIVSGDSDAIVIIDNVIYGLKQNSSCIVEASIADTKCRFNVGVIKETIEVTEATNYTIEPISELSSRSDFIKGADISSIIQVLSCGGKFYNSKGERESLYYQLKQAGFNYIRLRLWVDPKSEDGTLYGGGNNDLDTTLKIARIAKALGFKLLLDFHYSDFWADPGKQVVPRFWKDIETAEEMARAISDYTKSTLETFNSYDCLPDMVQIGNEISNGMIRHTLDDYSKIANDSLYSDVDSAILGKSGTANFISYLNAASSAVRSVDSKIEIVIHIDRGGNATFCNNFFENVKGVDYDIIGLSYYSFYHGNITNMRNNITALASKFQKRIVIAETSYAFTEENHQWNSSIFKTSSNNKKWEISPEGQSTMISEICQALVDLDNNLGYGLFYWEPAWLPVRGAGWAGSGTLATWADQALFNYDGVALPSLNTFNMLTSQG